MPYNINIHSDTLRVIKDSISTIYRISLRVEQVSSLADSFDIVFVSMNDRTRFDDILKGLKTLDVPTTQSLIISILASQESSWLELDKVIGFWGPSSGKLPYRDVGILIKYLNQLCGLAIGVSGETVIISKGRRSVFGHNPHGLI